MSLLAQLEEEAALGWPSPFWPQDDPRVRRQRLPERCCHGHDLAEHASWRWYDRSKPSKTYRYWSWRCMKCHRLPWPGFQHEEAA